MKLLDISGGEGEKEYLKIKIYELETDSNNKNIGDLYRRISNFKMGYHRGISNFKMGYHRGISNFKMGYHRGNSNFKMGYHGESVTLNGLP